MNKPIIVCILLSPVFLNACSNKQMYNALQGREKVECQKLPQSQYEECMEQVSESYESYQSKRKSN